jgi:hypothetical protein
MLIQKFVRSDSIVASQRLVVDFCNSSLVTLSVIFSHSQKYA